jgi:S-adenosylmethionine:tRNA-ribosyltransferase-isomerase (queuine synthetase)
VQAKTQ